MIGAIGCNIYNRYTSLLEEVCVYDKIRYTYCIIYKK